MRSLGCLCIVVVTAAAFSAAGCRATQFGTSDQTDTARNERHIALYGSFDLPRHIGTVENIGLQLPVISPDGGQMLYLQSDQDGLSLMTLLGSADPNHTPPRGALSVWLRPLAGTTAGQRFSPERWAHSPVWSDSGRAAAYVVNDPPFSFLVHVDLDTGERTRLGQPGGVNCLPRFADDDKTLLFCGGPVAAGPFRVYRQRVGQPEPAAVSPEGADCLFPLASSQDKVLCARADGSQLRWVQAAAGGTSDLTAACGLARRPHVLQMLAGVTSPLRPDGRGFLFYDVQLGRISTCDLVDMRVVRHRQGSIAACWLDAQAIALATADGVFVVDTVTGYSPGLFNGAWIPCRFVSSARRLLLLGRDNPHRFTIVEVAFRPDRPAARVARSISQETPNHAPSM